MTKKAKGVTASLIASLSTIDRATTPGYIYCVSHPTTPTRFKLGRTGGDVNQRIAVLNTSEVLDFIRHWDVLVYDHEAVERAIHAALADWRVSSRKEFFDLPPGAIWPLRDLIEQQAGADVREYINRATAWMAPV